MRTWENKIDPPTMTDELRAHGFGKAADEIERLRAQLDRVQNEIPLLKSDNAMVRENTIKVTEANLTE